VCFLFRKTFEVRGQAPRVAVHKKVPHLHTHTGWTAVSNPWYGPSWEEAWIPQGRKRPSWLRRPMALEPTGHLPPLVVTSHPRGRMLLKQIEGRLTRHSKVFRPVFAIQGPHLPRAHTPRLRRAPFAIQGPHLPCRPLICLPLTRGRRFSKGPRPPFHRRPTGGAPISLSLHATL
jgi:hypothetical protein